MFTWWNELSAMAHIFAYIAIPATLLLIVQTVLMLIGIGDHGDADVDIDTDVDTDVLDADAFEGFHLFSVRGIIAFFVVFGWVGVSLDMSGLHTALILLISAVCGFAMMVLVALLYKWALSLQSDGTVNIRNALGMSGTVYLTVPANRQGSGKVNITVQGAYSEFSAVTDSDVALETGKEVTVVGISGQNTLVVKSK